MGNQNKPLDRSTLTTSDGYVGNVEIEKKKGFLSKLFGDSSEGGDDGNNNPFFEEEPKSKDKNVFLDILQSVVIALSISIFLYLFILTPNEVDGPSMEPNFYTGQLLFTSKLHQWFTDTSLGDTLGLNYKRGDVIVFQAPGRDDFVKRIIAEPGDTIRIDNGVYYVNGKRLDEHYELDNDSKKDGSFLRDGDPAKVVPDGEYFVSGDHRDVSFDSREIGFVKREWIKGKVIFRFWPFDQFGVIGSGESELVVN